MGEDGGLISVAIVVERDGAFMAPKGDGVLSGLLGLSLALLVCFTLIIDTVQFLRNRRRVIHELLTPL